jgi:hypothetical protein
MLGAVAAIRESSPIRGLRKRFGSVQVDVERREKL